MPKMELNKEKIESLGLSPGAFITASASIRYPVGIIQRERERLAAIFKRHGLTEVANDILDTSEDDLVFKREGPEAPLATAPRSVEDRQKQKDDKEG